MWRRNTGDQSEASAFDPSAGQHRRILVVSASMGAGHDGAAREMAGRLRRGGHLVEVRDFLDAGPLRIGSVLKRAYEFELRHIPAAYDATYRLWYRIPWMAPVVSWLVTALTGRRMLRWVRHLDAEVVVSTYPLSTLCLGRLRRRGRLRIPAVNFITDFGVHPLWVHRGIDLNLTVHAGPARVARLRTGRPAVACGPLVSEAYAAGRDGASATAQAAGGERGVGAAGGVGALDARAEARRRWGLSDGDRAVLIVAGSWGVGGIAETFDAIAGAGCYVPVVVCGHDESVHRQLAGAAAAVDRRAVVVGWTDEMPSLMAACDALVENAGGLTSLEAMRAGLPVISFRPIAGHGVENTSTMAQMGVSRLAHDIPDLIDALDGLCTPGAGREEQIATARSMFVSDGAQLAVEAADVDLPPLALPARPAVRLVARTTTGLAALLALTWAGLTTGVSVATAAGAGVARPVAGTRGLAYVGVRLSASELADRPARTQLAALGITAVLDEQTARSHPSAVRSLTTAGVDIASGGRGTVRDHDGELDRPAQWNRARDDAAAGRRLSQMIGRPVTKFVPGRRVDVFDLVDSSDAHTRVVVPNQVWSSVRDVKSTPIASDNIVLVDGLTLTPGQLDDLLGQLRGALAERNITPVPFAALR